MGSRNIGKKLIAFLSFPKSALTRKYMKAQTIAPSTIALGSPPYALLRTFQSPRPAKNVQATTRNMINAGHSFRDVCSSPVFTLLHLRLFHFGDVL